MLTLPVNRQTKLGELADRAIPLTGKASLLVNEAGEAPSIGPILFFLFRNSKYQLEKPQATKAFPWNSYI